MAATSSSELTFVDEDDLPVAFLRIAHADSEDEAPSDVMADNSTCLDFFFFLNCFLPIVFINSLWMRLSDFNAKSVSLVTL